MRNATNPSTPGACRIAATAFFAIAFALLLAVALWPGIDLIVSGWFYEPGKGFSLDYNPAFQAIHWLATYGAWILAIVLIGAAFIAAILRRPLLTLPAKSWLFLLFALLIGPGLIANVGLKDHWGRARPAQVQEFGGAQRFSSALEPQPVLHKNGSFVAGDAAFGYFFAAFGYVVTRNKRLAFWSGMGAGIALSFLRITMGAHFLSDTLFAGLVVLGATAALHAVMFGRTTTRACWREWMYGNEK